MGNVLQVFLFSEQPTALSCENVGAVLRFLATRTLRKPSDFLPLPPVVVADLKQVRFLYLIHANRLHLGVHVNTFSADFYCRCCLLIWLCSPTGIPFHSTATQCGKDILNKWSAKLVIEKKIGDHHSTRHAQISCRWIEMNVKM